MESPDPADELFAYLHFRGGRIEGDNLMPDLVIVTELKAGEVIQLLSRLALANKISYKVENGHYVRVEEKGAPRPEPPAESPPHSPPAPASSPPSAPARPRRTSRRPHQYRTKSLREREEQVENYLSKRDGIARHAKGGCLSQLAEYLGVVPSSASRYLEEMQRKKRIFVTRRAKRVYAFGFIDKQPPSVIKIDELKAAMRALAGSDDESLSGRMAVLAARQQRTMELAEQQEILIKELEAEVDDRDRRLEWQSRKVRSLEEALHKLQTVAAPTAPEAVCTDADEVAADAAA